MSRLGVPNVAGQYLYVDNDHVRGMERLVAEMLCGTIRIPSGLVV